MIKLLIINNNKHKKHLEEVKKHKKKNNLKNYLKNQKKSD